MQPLPFHSRILAVCSRYCHRTLLRDDGTALTGENILKRISEIELILTKVSPNRARVGVLFANSAARALAILAVLATQRVPVILDAGESRFKVKSKSDALNKFDALNLSALITSQTDFPDTVSGVSTLYLDPSGAVARVQQIETLIHPEPPPAGTALILYTSGSTGEPKGVQVAERGLLYTVDHLIRYFGLDSNSKAAIMLPLSHSMGLNTQFLPTFFAGGECIFIELSLSLNRCYRNLMATESTFVSFVSEILRMCGEERTKRSLPAAETVKHVQIAGGIIQKEHVLLAGELFPNAVLHKGYGLTEAIRVSMISSLDPHFLSNTAGYPLPGQKVVVRNRGGVDLGPGVSGQIFVKGPNLMLNYENGMERPFTEDGFLATGDLGCRTENGLLMIFGRADSVFKVAGKRVSALEIERAVSDAGSYVREAKCIPVPDHKLGHRVVLFLEVTPEQRGDFLSHGIPHFEQTLRNRFPRTYFPKEVFIMEQFPRTGNGKLKNHTLTRLLVNKEESENPMPRNSGFRYRMVNADLGE